MLKRVAQEARANPGLVLMAGVGLAKGLHETASPAAKAWAVLGISVLAYDVLCPAGQTLSEGCAVALEAHKWLTTAAIGIVALHLSGLLPERYDPLHRLATIK